MGKKESHRGHGARARPHVRRYRIPRFQPKYGGASGEILRRAGVERPDRPVPPHAGAGRPVLTMRGGARPRLARRASWRSWARRATTRPRRCSIACAKLGMRLRRRCGPEADCARRNRTDTSGAVGGLPRSSGGISGATLSVTDDIDEGIARRGCGVHRRVGRHGRARRSCGAIALRCSLPYQRRRRGRDGQGERRMRHLHALPALVSTTLEHRPSAPRSHEQFGVTEMEVDGRRVRSRTPPACSKRPRIACTPSRPSCTLR